MSFKGKSQNFQASKTNVNETQLAIEATAASRRFEQAQNVDHLDSIMGFDRFEQGPKKIGWLVNMHPVSGSSFLIYGISR